MASTLVVAGLVWAPAAEAAIVRSFGLRFSTNTTGDVVLTGNAVTTCPASSLACTNARQATGPSANRVNNSYDMVYVDVDSVASTFNSSSADLGLPGGSRVLFAGLYWAGDTQRPAGGTAARNKSRKNRVALDSPVATTGYVEVTGTVVDADPNNAGPGNTAAYQAFADVTSVVAGARNGTYTVANIQGALGTDRWAGWALVVAYENSGRPSRNLTVFDGFGAVSAEATTGRTLTIPVTGFQTPPAGTVRTRIGTVVWEGEAGYTPDSLSLNGVALSNAQNPADNFFNSTISNLGVPVSARNPSYPDTLGVDIDRISADGKLPNSATSASIAIETDPDVLYPGVVTFATELFTPELVTTKAAADVNGGELVPGDVIEFTTTVDNTGLDASRQTVLTESVPVHTTFVPGSLRTGTTAMTDTADADTANFNSGNGVATFRLGSGATGTQGGSIPVGGSATASLQVRVNVDAPHEAAILNTANIAYVGDQTGLVLSGTSNTTRSTVTRPRADLRITKSGTPATVVAGSGSTVTYTLSVANDGPLADPGVTVTDTLPPGLAVTSTTVSQGSCSSAGGAQATVTCTLGSLSPGPTATVTINASAGAAADPSTDRAAVQGTLEDPDPADNEASVATAVTRSPQAADDTTATDTDTGVTVSVLANDSDPDSGDTLTVSAVTNGAHGMAVPHTGGAVAYTPTSGFAGIDTFTYTVADGRGGTATATVTVTVRNAAPVAGPDFATTTLATAVEVPVLGNDSDPNNDILSISGSDTVSARGGTITLDDNTTADPSDDRLVYAPPAGFKGIDTFGYTVADGRGGTASATVTVEVPDATPAAVDDGAATPYLTPVEIPVLDNDRDPNNDPLTVAAGSVTEPTDAGGTVRGQVEPAGGSLRYVPPAGFVGVVTFSYRATDGNGSDPATVTVTVANAPPAAADDSVSTAHVSAVTFDPRGNDGDPNGDPLQVTGLSAAGAGNSAALNPDGTVTYTPGPGFSGDDSFAYTIDDGRGGTAEATVRVTVANAPPVAADDDRSTSIDTAVAIPVVGNDTDPNPGDELTVVAGSVGVPNNAAGNPRGSTTLSADGKTITYTPPARFQGAVSFSYAVSDGTDQSTATVRVTVVNNEPVARDNGGITEPATPIMLDVLFDDSDPNGDALTIVGITQPGHGTASFDVAAGTVTYTPVAGYVGIDTFAYTVADGRGGSGTATVTVTVLDAPPVAVPDLATTGRNVATDIDALGNDSDPNGDPLALSDFEATSAEGGTVTRIDNGTAGDRTDDTLRYLPPPGYTGSDTFTYSVSDGRGGSSTGTVTVTVPDLSPTAVDDAAVVPTGASVPVAGLDNDTDPDADPLTVDSFSDPPHGSVILGPDRKILTYTADPGFAGEDRFTYTASDGRGGTAVATVVVTVLNAAPDAVDDRVGTGPASAVTVDVRANDHDENGDLLAIADFEPTTAGGGGVAIDPRGTAGIFDDVLAYTPAAAFKGSDTFAYTISDGRGGADTARVTVVVSDAPPVGLDDQAAVAAGSLVDIAVLHNDTDPNADPLSLVSGSVTEPRDEAGVTQGTLTLDPAGVIRYQAPVAFVGEVSFTYQVTDANPSGTPATATVRVTVTDLPPVAVDDTATTGRGTAIAIEVTANDSDPNGDSLTVVGLTGLRPGARLSVDGSRVSYTPPPGFTGEDAFIYTVDDGRGQNAQAKVTVTVPNEDPTAANDTGRARGEVAAVIAVLDNDADAGGDSLTVVGISDPPAHGRAVPNPDGTITYEPEAGYAGSDSFTYRVSDGRGGSAVARVDVTVDNLPPVAANDQGATGPAAPVTIPVLDNDGDRNPGQTLTVTRVGAPGHGQAVANSDGTVNYTPASGFKGTDSFTYEISDGAGGTSGAAVSVTVTDAAPVASDDTGRTSHATPVTLAVLANDFDPNPGDVLAVVPGSLSDPVDDDGVITGGVSPGSDGTVTYTPPSGFVGDVTFVYRVTDSDLSTPEDEATVTVTVDNASPAAVDDSASLAGEGPVAIAVLDNDSDANGDRLRIVGVSVTAHGGTTALDDAGTPADPGDDRLAYRPPPGFSGTDTLSYTVDDGRGGTDTAGVTVTVSAPPKVNNPPRFDVDVTNTVQNLPPGAGLAPLRAVDAEGQPLTYRVIDGALPPVLALQADGSFTGTAVAPGTYRATVQACDNSDPPACDDVSLTLAVTDGDIDRKPRDVSPPVDVPPTVHVPPPPDSSRPVEPRPVEPGPIEPEVGDKSIVAPPKQALPSTGDGRDPGSPGAGALLPLAAVTGGIGLTFLLRGVARRWW